MNTYQTQKKKTNTEKLRAILSELPTFCGYFFRSVETRTSILTRCGYALDLKGFFTFLVSDVDLFAGRDILSLTLADIEKVKALDIELYLDKMTLYTNNDVERENSESAKARKLSAIRSFFKYYYKQEMISQNVASLVDIPKIHEKAIIRLDANEVADLLDIAEDGDGLSKTQKRFHKATKIRDVAILTLFLGTGIRISELIGLDIEDIDYENSMFLITRKGGNQERLSFGDEVKRALLEYMEQRTKVAPYPGHEHALFLSLQRKRISARAVENLVVKYASTASPLKKITPHKLRSTYGTMLYHESNDIYLVADVLGHKDINTTRKHYAALSEEKRRTAAKMIKLREDDPH